MLQLSFLSQKKYLLFSFFLFCQVAVYAQEEPEELTLRNSPYTELDTALHQVNCLPLANVLKANLINFQSGSLFYFSVDNANSIIINNYVKFKKEGVAELIDIPCEWREGYIVVQLDTVSRYQLMVQNSCGLWTSIKDISTIPKAFTEPICVSEELGNAISDWKMNSTGSNLFEHLHELHGVPEVEKYEFLQDFIKNGELLDDIYMNGEIPDEAFIPSELNVEECMCRVLKIDLISEVYPTSSGQLDPTIHPAIFPNQIIRETNRIKFWHVGSFEGPARYQQIWGETKRCRNVTESAYWGENSNDPLANALGRTSFQIEQACRTGNWTPGDCYCTQNFSIRYRYDADLVARSGERDGACFNPPGKKAQAIVDDAVIVMVGKLEDPQNNNTAEIIFTQANAEGAVSECNKDFQEQRIIDIGKLGLAAYAMIKGIPVDVKNPVIQGILEALWDEYKKTSSFNSLQSLLTKPWMTGECVQASTNLTLDNTYYGILEDRERVIFTMIAASYLEVNGMTAWDATARVLSGFSTSLVLEKNENTGQPNGYCCTKPAGIYQTSSFHPLHGPTTYNQVIGAHLAPQLNCCFPVSPFNGQLLINDERNILIGSPILNCETVINQRNDNHFAGIDNNIKVYFDGSILLIEGLESGHIYPAELLSIDGRLIFKGNIYGSGPTVIEYQSGSIATGVYILKINHGRTSLTKKIIRS